MCYPAIVRTTTNIRKKLRISFTDSRTTDHLITYVNFFCIMCTHGLVTCSTLKPSCWIKLVYDNKLFQRRIHEDGKWTSANCYVCISIQHLNSNAVAVLSIFRDSQRRIKAKLENVYLTVYAFWPEDTPLNLSFSKEKNYFAIWVGCSIYKSSCIQRSNGRFHDVYTLKMSLDKQSYETLFQMRRNFAVHV